MARKREDSAKREVYCIRISEEEKTLLKNNPALKKELDEYIRMYLDAFLKNE